MKFTETQTFRDNVNENLNIKGYMAVKEQTDTAEQNVRDVFDTMIEGGPVEDHMLLHCLVNTHRTHQQQVVSKLFKLLKGYSEQGCDLRNADAREWAKKATQDDTYFPYI